MPCPIKVQDTYAACRLFRVIQTRCWFRSQLFVEFELEEAKFDGLSKKLQTAKNLSPKNLLVFKKQSATYTLSQLPVLVLILSQLDGVINDWLRLPNRLSFASFFGYLTQTTDQIVHRFVEVYLFDLQTCCIQANLFFLQRNKVDPSVDEFITLLYVNRVRFFECEVLTVQLHVDHVVFFRFFECQKEWTFVYIIRRLMENDSYSEKSCEASYSESSPKYQF